MFTKFKNWIKEKWFKLKQWGKVTFGVSAAMAASVTGADMAQFKAQPLPDRTIIVAEEQVKQKQVGNVAEVEMPWKGERGLKVKYDMGEVSAEERIKDKRNKQVVTETVDFGDGGFKIDILLDKKPDTNTFCYTIEGYENYDFFYQPALTQEQIDAGSIRPEEIVGSYAVYHKKLRDNIIGKTNYKTGKVMHIPFPYVWEVKNEEATKQRAENLTYSDGQLCVVVQQDFLRKAKYPVRIDPTFGYTSIGASSQNNNSGEDALGSSDTGVSGTLDKVSVAVKKDDSNASANVTYYFSNSSTNPSAIFSSIESESITTSFAWYDSNTTSDTLSGDPQYVAVSMAYAGNCLFSNCTQMAYDSGTGTNGGSYIGGTWFGTDTRNNSVYATYTVAVSDTCTYGGSGDWNVLYSDNCNVTSDTYVTGACNLIYDGAGSFGLQATLSCDEVNGGQGFMVQGLNDSGKLNIY